MRGWEKEKLIEQLKLSVVYQGKRKFNNATATAGTLPVIK